MIADILAATVKHNPARTLYHYTTQAGLLGIIERREIWATHTQYLNDAREYIHAVEILEGEIAKRLFYAVDDGRRVLADMAEAVKNMAVAGNVCVSSFSEDRDSLSQWRAYGGPTSGYAIGFNRVHLEEMSLDEAFYLLPCEYDPVRQSRLFEAFVTQVFDQNMKRLQDGERLMSEERNGGKIMVPHGGNLTAGMHVVGSILKDESFSAEKEWRAISLHPLTCTSKKFGVRCGTSMLIPYYRMPLAHPDRALKLDEIVVGPTPHAELSCGSVSSFLISQGLENVPVVPSAVPYRNW